MTPYEICFLFHCFTSSAPYQESFAKNEAIKSFIDLDLIMREEDYYVCTDRGCAYLKMIMTTPLPEFALINPETKAIIE